MKSQFLIIFGAEMRRRLTSRAFQIGLVLSVAGIWAIAQLPTWVQQSADSAAHVVAIQASPELAARAQPLLAGRYQVVVAPAAADPVAYMHANRGVAALLHLHRASGSLDIAVYARDPGAFPAALVRRTLLPLEIEAATGMPDEKIARILNGPVTVVSIESKFSSAAQADAARAIATLLITLLYVLVVVNSQLTMTSIAEEKTSRIAELLVSCVDLSTMLYAKIAASVTIAIVQLGLWALVGSFAFAGIGSQLGAAPTGTAAAGAPLVSGNPWELLAIFCAFFFVGLLQLSSIFAAAGSLINRPEDLGSIGFPLILPIMAALMMGIFALSAPGATWVVVSSFVPFVAPFVMVARVMVDSPPGWQIAVSLLVNVVTLAVVAILAGRVYRVGMLMYGRAPTFGQMLKAMRA
ncbi:MAG: ABC transporter permease [Vulcanimicrobiaceae bacterium]